MNSLRALFAGVLVLAVTSDELFCQTQTNGGYWLKQLGGVSLAELNSSCDVLLLGSVERARRPAGKVSVTEVLVKSVVAGKKSAIGRLGEEVEAQNTNETIYLIQDYPATLHSKSVVTLLPKTSYIFWLTRATNGPLALTNLSGSVQNIPAAATYRLTAGLRSVFCTTDLQEIQGKYKMPVFPYPWQSELLVGCIGTNDIASLKSVISATSRALRVNVDSIRELEKLSTSSSNPALKRIAREHLEKGVTNIFDYVSPRLHAW